MRKLKTLEKLTRGGIVAVIRGDYKTALKTVDACISGGIRSIEVTFTIPKVENLIVVLQDKYSNVEKLCIGAGTVLDVTSARMAIMAGAEFVVSPSFNSQVAKLCNLYQTPYMPGCITVTEIQTALEAGVDIIKLFPGSILGPNYISAIKAPFPQVNIMPTGGVDINNMADWFKQGAVAVGAGSSLVGPSEKSDFQKVKQNAEAFQQEFVRLSKNRLI